MVKETFAGFIQPTETSKVPRMSPRHHLALQLTVDGLSHAEIADKMGVTVKTVETFHFQISSRVRDLPDYYFETSRQAMANYTTNAVRGGVIIVRGVPEEIILTRREAEVAAHLVTGKSRMVMADDLSISERTLETHLERIYRKIGINVTKSSHFLRAVAILAAYTIGRDILVRDLRGRRGLRNVGDRLERIIA